MAEAKALSSHTRHEADEDPGYSLSGVFSFVQKSLTKQGTARGQCPGTLEVGRCNGLPLAAPNEKAGSYPGLFVYPAFLIASSRVCVVQTVETWMTS